MALMALLLYGLSCMRPELVGPARRTRPDVAAVAHGSPEIRVLLGGGPRSSVRLAVPGAYRVCPLGGTDVLARGERLGPVEVSCSPAGLKLGELEVKAPRVEVWPAKDGSVLVGDRPYRGRLRLLKRSDGTVMAINVIELEAYLASVVNGEMPPPFPPAAREAQAVAARTYAIFQIKTDGRSREFDLYDSVRSQHYPGMSWETDAGWQAVERTRGMVCTYAGKLFCTYYGSCCGGQTADARWVKEFSADAVPALTSVRCPYCNRPDNKGYAWPPEAVPKAQLSDRLIKHFRSEGITIGKLRRLELGQTHPDGRVRTVRVVHDKGEVSMPGPAFRLRVVGPRVLRSTRFTMVDKGDKVVFQAKGWGHGVGLCQWGARGLAEAGKDATEILQFYYPGSQLTRAY